MENKANKTLPDWPYMRTYEHKEMRFRSSTFRWGEKTYLMGIINVTPDSFSGDGIDILLIDKQKSQELKLELQ